MADLPPADKVLFDVTPRQLLAIAGDELPSAVPRGAQPVSLRAGGVQARLRAVGARAVAGRGVPPCDHRAPGRELRADRGGGADRLRRRALAAAVRAGRPAEPDRPDSRPRGHHTLWAYCHVPNGSDVDMSDAVEGQIERFAPGFRDLVLARAVRGPAEMEAENPNYIGGDINGGAGRPAPGPGSPGAADLALYDTQPPDLPVLLVDAPRRRRPRHVRLPRSPRRAVNNWCQAPIIHSGWPVGPQSASRTSLLTRGRRGRR